MSDYRFLSNFSICYRIVKWGYTIVDRLFGICPILPSLEESTAAIAIVKLSKTTHRVGMGLCQYAKGMWPLRKRMIKSTIVSSELEIVNWTLETDG